MFDLTSPVSNETVYAKVAIEAGKFFVRELLMDMFNKVLTACLSPLKLCQYVLAKGVRKHGSEAIF